MAYFIWRIRNEVIRNDIWKYFILSESEIEKYLENLQRQGWVSYTIR